MKRGDIFYADLRPVIGSEQGGIRPVLIIQNDVGNRHSPTVICAAITSKMNKAKLPTHIELNASKYDMDKDSVILLEQLRTLDKRRLKEKMGHLDEEMMREIDTAIAVSLGLLPHSARPAERTAAPHTAQPEPAYVSTVPVAAASVAPADQGASDPTQQGAAQAVKTIG